MRRLLLLLVVLLVAGAAYAVGHGPGECAWPNCTTIFDVRDYGAIADAVEASACTNFGTTEDTPINCTPAANPGTDNEAAFEAAINAAGAAGGGTVYIPCGLYRTDGWIDVVWDNIVIEGEGECSVVLPGGSAADDDTPARIFNICNSVVTCATQIVNFTARNFVIRDDDPFGHGSHNSEMVNVDSIQDFDFGEVLNFSGAAETAYFYWQEATTGNDKTLIYTEPSAGTIADGDVITGANSGATATIDGDPVHETTEETHGLYIQNVLNPVVENMQFHFLGDESVVFVNPTDGGRITNNQFLNVPATPSKGAAIDISGANNSIVSGNYIVLGLGSGPVGSNGGIHVVGSTTGPENTLVTNNIVVEPDDDANDHTSAEFGIYIDANTAGDTVNTSVLGNYVELDIDELGTCTVTGNICDEDADCGANYCDPATYNPGCRGATMLCHAIMTHEATNQIDGLSISDNTIVWNILALTNQAHSSLTISDNINRGAHGIALPVDGE